MKPTYVLKHMNNLDLDGADLLNRFSFPWSDRETPRTEFRAVWNEEIVRFRFEVDDDDLVLDSARDRDQAILGSDRVELFFARDAGLLEPYFGLEIDPRGWVYAYEARYYRRFDASWSLPNLHVNGEFFPGGYAVEGFIPVKSLRDMGCWHETGLHVGVYRAEFRHGEEGVEQDWISWVHPRTRKPDFHVPASFGRFELGR